MTMTPMTVSRARLPSITSTARSAPRMNRSEPHPPMGLPPDRGTPRPAFDFAARLAGRPPGDGERGEREDRVVHAGHEDDPHAAQREQLVLTRERGDRDEQDAAGEPAQRAHDR